MFAKYTYPSGQLSNAAYTKIIALFLLFSHGYSLAIELTAEKPAQLDNKIELLENISIPERTDQKKDIGIMGAALNLSNHKKSAALNPHVTCGAAGNALITWYETNPETRTTNIYARTFDPTTESWSHTYTLSNSQTMQSNNPLVACNTNGAAIVAWHELHPEFQTPNIYARIFDGYTSSWSTTYTLSNNQRQVALNPHIACAAGSNACITWYETNPESYTTNIYARIFDQLAQSWSQTYTLSNNEALQANNPCVACSSIGTMFVVWHELCPEFQAPNIYARIFDGTTESWSQTYTLSKNQKQVALNPHIACDADGNACVAWYETNPESYTTNIYARIFDQLAQSWSQTYTLSNNETVQANNADAACSEMGAAFIAWHELNTEFQTPNIYIRQLELTAI